MDGSEEIDTTIVSVKLDSSGDMFSGHVSVYDILMHDTQYVNVVFRGSKISTDSFETLFRKSSAFIEGVPVIMADRDLLKRFHISPFPTVILFDENGKEIDRCEGFDEDWYKGLLDR